MDNLYFLQAGVETMEASLLAGKLAQNEVNWPVTEKLFYRKKTHDEKAADRHELDWIVGEIWVSNDWIRFLQERLFKIHFWIALSLFFEVRSGTRPFFMQTS